MDSWLSFLDAGVGVSSAVEGQQMGGGVTPQRVEAQRMGGGVTPDLWTLAGHR